MVKVEVGKKSSKKNKKKKKEKKKKKREKYFSVLMCGLEDVRPL